MAIIDKPVTVEEIKEYMQIRTPDYALLASYVNKAKGPDRAMAQFAEDTGIGASTLSRIVNSNIKKPLSIDTIIAIFEARADKNDLWLLDSLARANGLHEKEYAERVQARADFSARRNAEISRERMMKNALIAGVAASGMPVKEVVNNPRLCLEKVPLMYPRSYGDFMLDLRSDSNHTIIEDWAFYLYPYIYTDEDRARRPLRMMFDQYIRRATTWFLLDAWEPEEVKGMKVSFAFVDKQLFDLFKDYVQNANLHNEMTLILMDQDDFRVISEVWIPGDYKPMTNISVFDAPMPGSNDDSDDYDEDGIFDDDDDGNW